MRLPTRLAALALAVLALLPLSACGVNDIPTYEEQAKAAWSEVLNQYQRRVDLIPNLVETVKGFAAHERATLEAVVEARGKATQIQVTPETLTDPAAFQQFQASQEALSSALVAGCSSVVEQYPELKSNQNFLTLQAQLEAPENRIAVARRDYIQAVALYNTELKTFPGRWWASLLYSDAKPMETFTIAPEAEVAPKVDFDTTGQ